MNTDPKHSILIVDDDPDDRESIRDAFLENSYQHEYIFFGGADELMHYMQDISNDGHPALILLDLNMPGMNGKDALKQLKTNQQFRHIPIVIMTTSSSHTDKQLSYMLGANCFITKPDTFTKLVDIADSIAKLLGSIRTSHIHPPSSWHKYFTLCHMFTHNIDWRIGCSGFHYADWKEIFYPAGLPQKKWFDYYCTHFNTLELNVTFYRFPQPRFLENWYAISPPGFDFSVKAPRLITHYKQFTDTERLLNDFYTTTREGLRDKLGCILFQLPARMLYSDTILDRIIGQLDTSLVNMVEFRHESWWNAKVIKKLAANGIGFCGHSYPLLPDKVVCNIPVVYYRFHGLPKLYYSQYKRAFIEQVAEAVAASKARKAYMYFNNTATIAAIRNARYLQQLARKQAAMGK